MLLLLAALAAAAPTKADVDAIAKPVPVVGLIVGILDGSAISFHGYGETALGNGVVPTSSTVFEIGSITKVFTGILLAEMAGRGEVRLDQEVSTFLPAPAMTLEELASHSAGLPQLPDNITPADPADPYADYDDVKLRAYVAAAKLGPKAYVYSNVGMGLLGHILALKAKTSYGALVETRVLRPLGLKSTGVSLAPAQPHAGGSAVPPWTITSLAGAGALRSSASDMVRFLQANMDPSSPLAAALGEARRRRNAQAGLGWHLAGPLYWHNGGTGGSSSFLAYDPGRRKGVVLLANGFVPADLERAALQLLALP